MVPTLCLLNLSLLKVGMQIVALFCILGTVRRKVFVDPKGRGSIIPLSHIRNLFPQPAGGDFAAMLSTFGK